MKSLKTIEAIKGTWNEYASLIKALTAVFLLVSSGVGFISGIIINNMVKSAIQTDVGQVKAVTDLTSAVSTLTATVEANTASATRLDSTVSILQSDVTAIHKHLAGIE